jgi:tRNA dimethylallyltransferase
LNKVYVVGGPTASGKSDFAHHLAQKEGGVILNADSLQVYAGLEILTDQPSSSAQHEIPYGLYGFLDPTQSYSVGMWFSQVLKEIENAHKKGKLPIVVGGTGFYLKTLLEGMTSLPSLDPQIRQELEDRGDTQEFLYHELQNVDKALADRIHPHDHQRTLRGLEVFYGTGMPLSTWQRKKPKPLPYTFETILFMPENEDLRTKISTRIEDMVAKDVLDEVAALLPLPLSPTARKAIGLREFGSFIKGLCSLEQAKELTFIHTCQYAKRQRTWFRNQFTE